ncbi:MAG TPA: hypothetical protein VGC30_16020, partial [Dokdonella sp.]
MEPAIRRPLTGSRWSMAASRSNQESHHEMGNPAGRRHALRLRNHDVHFDALSRAAATRRRRAGALAASARASAPRFPVPSVRPLRMRVHVLGSAAGGGFPQWNCNCRLC